LNRRGLQKRGLFWLFFRYYIILACTLALLVTLAGWLLDTQLDEDVREDALGRTADVIQLMRSDYARTRADEWSSLTRYFNATGPYSVALLDAPAHADMWLSSNGDLVYARLGPTHTLVIGPIDALATKSRDLLLNTQHQLELVVTLLVALGFGIGLYAWLKPQWRDLIMLLDTAERLGEGQLTTRAPPAESRLFQPMVTTLNSMASRLDALLASRQVMAHALAHELKTPLARLRFGLALHDTAPDPQARAQRRAGIDADLEELDRLISDSLGWVRMAGGQVELRSQPLSLAHWLAEQITPVARAYPALEIHCQVDTALTATLDPVQFGLAIRNLLGNAARHARSRIDIAARIEEDDSLTLTVDDDGPGIPEDARERIFEPFVRLDAARNRESGGTGLGLALARAAVELHHGKLSALESPLGGARFCMSGLRPAP